MILHCIAGQLWGTSIRNFVVEHWITNEKHKASKIEIYQCTCADIKLSIKRLIYKNMRMEASLRLHLECRVHEACVAKVTESTEPRISWLVVVGGPIGSTVAIGTI